MITIIFNHLQWPLCIHIYICHELWKAGRPCTAATSAIPAIGAGIPPGWASWKCLSKWRQLHIIVHCMYGINSDIIIICLIIYIYMVSNDSYILYTYIYIYIFIWYIYNHIYICIHIMHWYIYIYLTRSQCSFNKKLPVSSWSRAHCRFGLGNEPRLGSPQWGLRPGSRSVGCSEPSEPRVWRFLF